MKPLVSIIVPVYNVSKYIEQCLNSLTNQTMKEIEIIVVDDCGTDDSIIKAQKIADKDNRIKIIHNKANQGLGESRNIGLKYVKTEYVAFLDSDDWVAEDFIEKLYNACIKENADIAVSDVIYYYNQNKQTREWVSIWNFKSGKEIIFEPKDKQYNIYACACWNKLYNMELFTKYNLKFPKGLKYEDVPVTVATTILAHKVCLVDDTKLYYRQREGSIMHLSSQTRQVFDMFKIYEYMDNLISNICDQNDKNYPKYINIIDNFKIFHLYGWYNNCHPIFKDEFWQKMKQIFIKIDIKNNPFITSESRNIYTQVCYNDRVLQTIYTKLFDLLPLFKYRKTEHSIALYLFDFIPLFKYKHKMK